MDKDRAFTEIENILYSKEHENKTLKEHRKSVFKLDELGKLWKCLRYRVRV